MMTIDPISGINSEKKIDPLARCSERLAECQSFLESVRASLRQQNTFLDLKRIECRRKEEQIKEQQAEITRLRRRKK